MGNRWSERGDSNPRPSGPKPLALTRLRYAPSFVTLHNIIFRDDLAKRVYIIFFTFSIFFLRFL